MNVCKAMGIMSVLMVSHCAQSMQQYQDGLSAIEKQLVLREVAIRGRDVVEKEILQERTDIAKRYDKKNDQFRFTRPSKLEITADFSQSQIGTDPLAKIIFERIAEIEKKSGYFPDKETNFLGRDTRYYWVKKDKKKNISGVVTVESHFKQREPLLEIIKQ